MLAALLTNRIGNTAGKVKPTVDEDKVNRALDALRADIAARKPDIANDIVSRETDPVVQAQPVYKIPKIEPLTEAAADEGRQADDELAILLILAEL